MSPSPEQIRQVVGNFIIQNSLLPLPDQEEKDFSIVVGLSGGPDSVVLAHILLHLGYREHLILTHCNFHLRGEESDRDERFCIQLAQQWGLPLQTRSFDTMQYMKEKHLSLEMACRELRYNWWNTIVSANNSSQTYICVGHHQDDSIETILMNLMRGTGIDGLTGIRTINEHVVRPLLCLNRNKILYYLQESKLKYITDSSNLENDFLRNKIRNQLLPLMEEINANAKNGILHTANILKNEQKWTNIGIEFCLKQHTQTTFFNGEKLNLIALQTLKKSHNLPNAVYHYLQYCECHPSEGLAHRIAAEITSGSKNITYEGNNHYLCLTSDALIVHYIPSDIHETDHYTWTPEEGWEILSKQEITSQTIESEVALSVCAINNFPGKGITPAESWMDADTVAFPLHFRRWKQGDRISPFGMKGSRLVSDIFSDAHYSPIEKKLCWIVTDNLDNILYISNLRASSYYSITPITKRVIHLQMLTNISKTIKL